MICCYFLGIKGKKKKESTPEKKYKKGYKNALAYLQKIVKNERIAARHESNNHKIGTIVEEEAPKVERLGKKLTRANAVSFLSPRTESKNTTSLGKASKRFWLQDEEERIVKKPKPSKSFKSPQKFQIYIIDRSDTDGKMLSERWIEVQRRILLSIAAMDYDDSDEGIS